MKSRDKKPRVFTNNALTTGVLVIGSALSFLFFFTARRMETRQHQNDLYRRAASVAVGFERTMGGHRSILEGLEAFFAASEKVEKGEFGRYVEFALNHEHSFEVLAWAPRVSAEDRNTFEAERQTETPGYRVCERGGAEGWAPAAPRAEYFPISYLESGQNGRLRSGFDLTSEVAGRKAIDRARNSGRPTSAWLECLGGGTPDDSAVVLLYPVYRKGARLGTVADRHANLEGFVLGSLRVGELARAAFPDLEREGLEVALIEGASPSNGRLRWASPRAVGLLDQTAPAWSKTVTAAGQTWSLSFFAQPGFGSGPSAVRWIVLGLGLAATCLLAGRLAATSRNGRAVCETNEQLRSALQSEGQALREVELLDALTERINRGTGLKAILDYVYESFDVVFPYDRICFALIDPPGVWVRGVWARTRSREMVLPADYQARLDQSSLREVVATGKPRVLPDLEAYSREHPDSEATRLLLAEGIRSSLTCPLIANGKPVGFLFFSSCQSHAYAAAHVRRFERIARQLSVTVERALCMDELEAKRASLEEEIARRRTAERTLSLAYERQKDRFQAGGTLRHDALSYVERSADRELYDGLLGGDLCYVLTSRQMGKSSLMARTANRLKQQKVAAVILDLTSIGQNLTADQWYEGLLSQIGWQLGLEPELESFCLDRPRLGPAQRCFKALREVVLARTRGALVVFIDEVDSVRSLQFSTNEFFAAIRETHNRRSADEELHRLVFCLLGAAAPSDLVTDPQITPFNIGRRIVLQDFTPAEAWPLAQGLGRQPVVADELMQRIFYWTNGHPYLTQRLCLAVANDPSVQTAAGVDTLCRQIFLAQSMRDEDPNLLYVRDSLLRFERAQELLRIVASVCNRQPVELNWTEPVASHLDLCGILSITPAGLQFRNRVYEHVFDAAWVHRQLGRIGPGADLEASASVTLPSEVACA